MNAVTSHAPARASTFRAAKIRCCAFLTAASLLAAAAIGQAEVREVYRCSFVGNAGMKELMGARDFLVEQSARLGITNLEAFVWTPYKVDGFDGDFLWFGNHADLTAFAATEDTYAKSSEGTAIQARFDKIVDCHASMSTHEQIFAGTEEMTITPPALIASFACKLNHGQSMENVRDLITHYQGVLTQSGQYKAFEAYMDVPMISATDNDLYVYGVHPDIKTWAARATAMQSGEAGRMLGRHAAQVMDCNSALWWGQRVIPAM